MIMRCAGSGSKGNTYIIGDDDGVIILDVGINFSKEIKPLLDFNIGIIKAVLVTHEHGDHAKYIKDYLKAGINVYMPEALKNNFKEYNAKVVKGLRKTRIGSNFVVTPFNLPHDGTENLGYLIENEKLGKLLYLTDFEYCKFNFKSLNVEHILIETNYDKKFITGNKANYEHVLRGHASLETSIEFLKNNCTENIRNVILLHLSDTNSNESYFLEEVKKVVDCNVQVAKKGLYVNLESR